MKHFNIGDNNNHNNVSSYSEDLLGKNLNLFCVWENVCD